MEQNKDVPVIKAIPSSSRQVPFYEVIFQCLDEPNVFHVREAYAHGDLEF